MSKRRDDIVAEERLQIAIEMLAPERTWGTVSRLGARYGLSRQAIYDIAAKGERVLRAGMAAGEHGPQVKEGRLEVNRNRVQRGVLTLTEIGASQRDVVVGLAEMLDTKVSLGWVNGQLAQMEEAAAQENQAWQPVERETLSGDEIYANGEPNLLVVGNESLYIYELVRPGDCDGDSWGCILLEMPEGSQFASDAGTGLAAGVKAAEVAVHQLDWDHLLRPLWGQVSRLEKKAYAALQKIEERATKFEQARSEKRLQKHLAAWEKLVEAGEEQVEQLDKFYQIARAVDDWFALIDLETGQLFNAAEGQNRLQSLGQELTTWSGRIYQKLCKNLQNWASSLFNYQPLLSHRLSPLVDEYGQTALAALCRLWQCEADEKRRQLSWPERMSRQQIWRHSLDEAVGLLGEERLWLAWDALCQVLGQSWRGSMLAECINSLLRPVLNRRKHTDQGCLELFRFLHNSRPFARGKRAGYSPAQLVGIDLPDDPLILLGLAPKVSS